MCKLKLFLIALLLLGNSATLFSQTERRHIIIAVDGAMPAYTETLSEPKTQHYVERVLRDFFDFTDRDYLSIVSYQIDLSNPVFNRFAFVPLDKKGKAIAWRRLKGIDLTQFGWWRGIVSVQPGKYVGSNKASFQSAAKPYILKALKADSNNYANETFIVMLSDELVNGTDNNYQLEWNNISTARNSRIASFRNQVFSTLGKINANYRFAPVQFFNTYKHTFANISSNPFVMTIYKVMPNVQPAIQSIANIPARLPFKKVRGGYTFDLDLTSLKSDYMVDSVELAIPANGKVYRLSSGKLTQAIDRKDLSEGDTVVLKTWVRYKDGIYNGLEMSPDDKDYAAGLTIRQAVVFTDDARIFGKIPLSDFFWWFYPENIQAAVIIWDVILILIFIGIVCWVAYTIFNRVTRYIPDNNQIKIKKIDGHNN